MYSEIVSSENDNEVIAAYSFDSDNIFGAAVQARQWYQQNHADKNDGNYQLIVVVHGEGGSTLKVHLLTPWEVEQLKF